MTIGKNIKEKRTALGMSQATLAKRIGVATSLVWHWENGYTRPNVFNAWNLADLFGCTIDELCGRGETKNTGKWVRQKKKPGEAVPEAVCSKCGRDVVYQAIDYRWAFENYCPHCGAKMKGGE